jgi:hypothetical protein
MQHILAELGEKRAVAPAVSKIRPALAAQALCEQID